MSGVNPNTNSLSSQWKTKFFYLSEEQVKDLQNGFELFSSAGAKQIVQLSNPVLSIQSSLTARALIKFVLTNTDVSPENETQLFFSVLGEDSETITINTIEADNITNINTSFSDSGGVFASLECIACEYVDGTEWQITVVTNDLSYIGENFDSTYVAQDTWSRSGADAFSEDGLLSSDIAIVGSQILFTSTSVSLNEDANETVRNFTPQFTQKYFFNNVTTLVATEDLSDFEGTAILVVDYRVIDFQEPT